MQLLDLPTTSPLNQGSTECSKGNPSQNVGAATGRQGANIALQAKISAVILTVFFCWLPYHPSHKLGFKSSAVRTVWGSRTNHQLCWVSQCSYWIYQHSSSFREASSTELYSQMRRLVPLLFDSYPPNQLGDQPSVV